METPILQVIGLFLDKRNQQSRSKNKGFRIVGLGVRI